MEPNNRKIRCCGDSTIAAIDYGYRYFWRKRGKTPPRVSEWLLDEDFDSMLCDLTGITGYGKETEKETK